MILRAVYRLAAPPGPGSRLTVMIFHRVLKEPDPLLPSEPDEQQFEARMRAVRAWFNVLPLAEAIGRLQAGALPARPLAISFDDGYADNFEVALPVLRKLGLPATFFVATGFLDGGCMWNDTVIETVRRSGERSARSLGPRVRTPSDGLDRGPATHHRRAAEPAEISGRHAARGARRRTRQVVLDRLCRAI